MSCCLWSLFIRLILSCCFVHIFSLSLYQVVIIAPQCSWAFIVVFFILYFSHLLAVLDSMSNLSAFISLPNSYSISILAALGSTWFVSQNMWHRTLQKTCFFSFREKGKVAKKQTPMMTLNFLRQFNSKQTQTLREPQKLFTLTFSYAQILFINCPQTVLSSMNDDPPPVVLL